ASWGTRYDRPTRTAGSCPACTSRYTVILDTRIVSATSATVRYRSRDRSGPLLMLDSLLALPADRPSGRRHRRRATAAAHRHPRAWWGWSERGEQSETPLVVPGGDPQSYSGSRPCQGKTSLRVARITRSTGSAGS